MSTANDVAPALARQQERQVLSDQWRVLARAATFVAVLTSPAAFTWFHNREGWSIGWSLGATILVVVAFRGLVDLILRRFIPWPSLFGIDDERLREDDVLSRRRAWFWARRYRLGIWILGLLTLIWLYRNKVKGTSISWVGNVRDIGHGVGHVFSTPQLWIQIVFVVFLFLDEIDAVGMRRAALGGAPSMTHEVPDRFEDLCFYGPYGALTRSGDLVLETRGWRERLFEQRAPERVQRAPGRVAAIVNQMFPGMMG